MPKLRLDGDGKGAVKAFNDLTNAINKADEALDGATLSAKTLEKAAGRIAKANESPQDKYNRKIAELALLVKQGKLSMDDAQRAAMRYQKSLERAGQSGKQAFGASAIGDLRSFALQFASVSFAIGQATQAFQFFAAERERARQASLQARAGYGELGQLAATADDPAAAYAAMLAEARNIRAVGAADNQQEAAGILFSMISAGLDERDRQFAVSLRSTGVLNDIGGTATAYAALVKALGREEVGSFEEVISKALAASSAAPALASEIPQAATRAGGSARALGINDEFLLAATAILASKTGTAAEGGTQLAAFLKGIEKKAIGVDPTLEGLSGLEIVQRLASGDQSRATLANLLGDRQEGIEGFRTLRDNLPELVALIQKIEKAQQEQLARTAQGLPLTDTQTATALALAETTGGLEIAQGEYASLKDLVQAAFNESRRLRGGEGGFNDWTRQQQLNFSEFTGTLNENVAARLVRQIAASLEGSENENLLRQIRDRLGEHSERLRHIGENQTRGRAINPE